MAEKIWLGGAPAVAQVSTITVAGTWAANDTATLTIGNITLTLTVGTDITTTAIATALKEMFNGDTQTGTGDHVFSNTGDNIPQFNEITATSDAAVITFTGDTAGKPFTITPGEVTAGDGAMGAFTEVTAATGPNDWGNADNWDTDSVPASSDDVVIDGRSEHPIKYGLDQNAVTLASLTILNSYTQSIGLAEINADVSGETYPEYRETYLKVSATLLHIQGEGNGSGRIKLDVGSNASTMSISAAGRAVEAGIPAVLIVGTNSSNVARVTRGDVGFAFYDKESAHLATLDVGFETNAAGDATVRCGDGVDITDAAITQSGGTLTLNSTTSGGTIVQSGGALFLRAGAHASVTADGTLHVIGTGTITALSSSGGVLDFRRGSGAVTVSACVVGRGSSIHDPAKRVTWSTGLDLTRCAIKELQELDLGKDLTITPSAI